MDSAVDPTHPTSWAAASKLVKWRRVRSSVGSPGSVNAEVIPVDRGEDGRGGGAEGAMSRVSDGNAGVFQRGVQVGSAVDGGLTPSAPSRITVTGRTVLYVYLTFQASIPASAQAMSPVRTPVPSFPGWSST